VCIRLPIPSLPAHARALRVHRATDSVTSCTRKMEGNRPASSSVYTGVEGWPLADKTDIAVTGFESESFALFYDAWRDPIRRALALAIGDTTLADEAIDEAMTRALVRWDQVDAYERPEGWVYRVGLNFARDIFRKRRREVLEDFDASAMWSTSEPIDIDVIDAVGRLSLKLRSVVVARFYLDWTVVDIAESLGVPEGTVKSRLSRALQRLADDLGEEL